MAPNRTLDRRWLSACARTLAGLAPLAARERGIRRGCRSRPRHRQHGLAAHQQRARADDDAARARAVLRRPGAREERALALHAVPGVGGRGRRALDPGRLHARLRARATPSSAISRSSARRHRHQHALGHLRHPRVRVRDVPGDVRDHHARADDRRLRGAHALRRPTWPSSRSGCCVVYCPLAHMVWGGGWIGAIGAKDFAGGLVVHMSSGYSALVAAIFLGKRRGFGKEPMPPHNLPFAVIGAGAAVGRLVRLQRRQRADGRRHRRRSPSSPRAPPPRPRSSPGWRSSGCTAASRPCSARPRRSWRASSRSRRPARS